MRSASLFSATIAVVLVGCNEPQSEFELTSDVPPPDAYETTTTYDSGYSESWSGDTYAQADTGYDGGGRVHVVQRRDTLFGLARSYYGDAAQWKRIYQANTDQISDPNKIQVGMKLVIP